MTENEAIARIRYRIDTATDIAGNGVDGKAYVDMEMAIKSLEEIQHYRAMEQSLQKVYGVCDGLLEKVVEHINLHKGIDLQEPVFKARLLTDDEVDKWEAYKVIGTVEECREARGKQRGRK